MEKHELDNRLMHIRDKLIDIERKSDNRIYLLCEAENCYEVCRILFEEFPLRFVISTGVDAEHCFEVLHHFANDQTGSFVTVRAFIRDRENPSIDSISVFLPGAQWIEREMHDILGIEFKGHPDMRRLILFDNWPEGVYPLRKEVKK
jgi:Ni,Fe-hydrogenase III component G